MAVVVWWRYPRHMPRGMQYCGLWGLARELRNISPGLVEAPQKSATSPLMGKTFHLCRRRGMRIASTEKKTCVAKRRNGIRGVATEDVEYGGAIVLIMYAWRAVRMSVCSDVGDIECTE